MHILSSDLSKMNTVNGNSLCVCGEKTTQVTRFPPYNSYALIWAPKNWSFWIVVLEKTLESPLDCKEIQPVHPKGDQSRMFIGRTDAEAETPILGHPMWRAAHLKRPWCWERLKAGGEGDDRGWDGWMASATQRTWVWVNSGRPGVLQSMESQRVRHDWATDLNWTESILPHDGLTASAISTLTLWLSKKSTADKRFVPTAKCKAVRFIWGNIISVFRYLMTILPSKIPGSWNGHNFF